MLKALDMMISQRRPGVAVVHSDPGLQYASIAYGNRCQAFKLLPSMGTAGDCFDNSMVGSFCASLGCELVDRAIFQNHARRSSGWLRISRVDTVRANRAHRSGINRRSSSRTCIVLANSTAENCQRN